MLRACWLGLGGRVMVNALGAGLGRWRGCSAGHGRTRQGRRAIEGRAGQCRGQAGRVRQGAGQARVRAGRRAAVAAGNADGNRLRRCRQLIPGTGRACDMQEGVQETSAAQGKGRRTRKHFSCAVQAVQAGRP